MNRPELIDRFAAIYERDIDLLLIEELSCSFRFTEWFYESVRTQVTRVKLPQLPRISCNARHSVGHQGEGGGETDIVATFSGKSEIKDDRVLLLIEDKIDAQFTERQPERYVLRCRELEAQEKCPGATVLVAPSSYFDASADYFDARISYEVLAEQIRRNSPVTTEESIARCAHRASIIDNAISKLRRGGNRSNDEFRTRWFEEYYRAVQGFSPTLQQKPARQRSLGSRSFFFSLYPRISTGVDELYLEHGLDRGFVAIYFRGWGKRRDYFLPLCRKSIDPTRMILDCPAGKQFIQVRISGLPSLRFGAPIVEQLDAVRTCALAAAELLSWYQAHLTDFESWVAV